jgi:hypothetical protein
MVYQTKVLLVKELMVLRQILFGAIGLLLSINSHAYASPLEANQCSGKPCQFWLWPGAKLPQDGAIDRLYLLQGFFSARNRKVRFIDQGQNATRLKQINELVLVYRLDSIQPASNIVSQFHKDAKSWINNGNHVSGLQLDFDSSTGNIKQYNQFLQEIRRSLDAQYELSITGLMDWINTPLELTAAKEVVLQTYQGKRNVAHLDRYLAHLIRVQKTIPIDFKLGIVQGATLPDEIIDNLSNNPRYRGQVIFLLRHNRSASSNSTPD